MDLFVTVFFILVVLCVAVRYQGSEGNQVVEKSHDFKKFQNNFLLIYFIVMGADWLQGPYVYALYESYGFDKGDIAILFIGGFMSSLVFGTFVGSLADK